MGTTIVCNQFTILIGSCARGTHGPNSDLDVVRVGHETDIPRTKFPQAAFVSGPVTFIDYDEATFQRLHQQGSLFLHHIFREGVLIQGSEDSWRLLSETFNVRPDFSVEIAEYVSLYRWLNDPGQFENAEEPLLSHLFRVLKNIAIFALAERQIYVFEKRDVLSRFLPGLPKEDIDLLIDANMAFERNLCDLKVPTDKLAQEFLTGLFKRIDREIDKAMSA